MTEHVTPLLGAFSLGALDETDTEAVLRHLCVCEGCAREATELNVVADALGSVPPEILLDGPPKHGDLLLRRTLRTARHGGVPATTSGHRRLVVAAVLLFAATIGVGVFLGRQTAPTILAHPPAAPALPAGTRTLSALGASGVRLSSTIIPADGWVWVHSRVSGVAAGTRCRLVVVSDSGEREVAGSWLADGKTPPPDASLVGTAVIDSQDVSAVQLVTTGGKQLAIATG